MRGNFGSDQIVILPSETKVNRASRERLDERDKCYMESLLIHFAFVFRFCVGGR